LKCKHCGKKIVRFPLKDEQGKFIWKNLFKMEIRDLIMFLIIIFMVIGYKADIQKCEQVIEEPCEFCEQSNCCEYLIHQEMNPETIPLGIDYNWTIS